MFLAKSTYFLTLLLSAALYAFGAAIRAPPPGRTFVIAFDIVNSQGTPDRYQDSPASDTVSTHLDRLLLPVVRALPRSPEPSTIQPENPALTQAESSSSGKGLITSTTEIVTLVVVGAFRITLVIVSDYFYAR